MEDGETREHSSVGVSAPATISFVTEAGVVSTVEGERATYEIPRKDGSPGLTYVRIQVADDSGERLFLQPVVYD